MSRRKKPTYPPPFRSGYEYKIGTWLKENSIEYKYEDISYEYDEPLRKNRSKCEECGSTNLVRTGWYTPDFFIKRKGMGGTTIIEAKGRFTAADRRKALAVREHHPDLEIKYMFMRDNKLSKNAKQTYTTWCEAQGLDCVVGIEPKKEWL